jgi:hypothetical protein
MKGLISIVMISVSLLGLSNAYAGHEAAGVAAGAVHDEINYARDKGNTTLNEKALEQAE